MKAILTKPEKERLLEQFEKSGKTHAQFAEENGLNVKTLSKWIYEWHHQIKTTNEVKFVEIKTTAISSVNDIKLRIRIKKQKEQSKNIIIFKSCNHAARNGFAGFNNFLSVPYADDAWQSVAFRRLSYSFLAVW